MVDYPYTAKVSSLEDFLKKMATRPEPTKVTQEYLKSTGYTSSSDRQTIPVLRFIKFIDTEGVPTPFFKQFRDTRKSRAIMAQAMREGYAELFETVSNPCQATNEDLDNFFRTKTGRGEAMLEITVNTFKSLCTFADFGAAPVAITPTVSPTPTYAPITATSTTTPVVQLPVTREGGVNVNVNIRLELPATQDATVYDKIFESLKKHLLTPTSKSD
jgi:hypothetical protein